MNESKSCKFCRFSSMERPNPQMIEPLRMCRHGPLTALTVHVADAQGNMHQQIRAVCPAVHDTDWCHCFEPLPPLSN